MDSYSSMEKRQFGPVLSLPVPVSQNAEPRGNDPVIAACLLALGLFAWTVVSLSAGMKASRFAHWTGEALLVIGVLLAAKGISNVRHQWVPQKLGIWGAVEARAHRAWKAGADRFWLYNNRLIERHPGLTRFLRLRIHQTTKQGFDWAVGLDTAGSVATALPPRLLITGGTAEERIERLERRLAALEDQHDVLRAQYNLDSRTRQLEMEREAAKRTSAVARLREHVDESLADAVGGGLQLQTAGVVCLLVGTVLTAIWP